MTEFDIAHCYTEEQLRRAIDGNAEERNFWFSMMVNHPEDANLSFYTAMRDKYEMRTRELKALLAEKFK